MMPPDCTNGIGVFNTTDSVDITDVLTLAKIQCAIAKLDQWPEQDPYFVGTRFVRGGNVEWLTLEQMRERYPAALCEEAQCLARDTYAQAERDLAALVLPLIEHAPPKPDARPYYRRFERRPRAR